MLNTGFSWMRIDKGNIHCNFRYLDADQINTVLNYLASFYEYQNIDFGIVDLASSGVVSVEEAAAHYRPSGADPNKDYYYLVQLHRHGSIIPQGCIEIMKQGINAIARKEFIPESIFIDRLKSSNLTVDDHVTLNAHSVASAYTDATWASSDTDVITVTPSGSDLSCNVVAVGPGTADISVTVTVDMTGAVDILAIPTPSAAWVGPVFKYIGTTVTMKQDGGKLYPQSHEGGVAITFTQNSYYECVFDDTLSTKYKWQASSYDGTPTPMDFTDVYTLNVKSYVRIVDKTTQRLCLYHSLQLTGYSPSGTAGIEWLTSGGAVSFVTDLGETCTLDAIQTGAVTITARLIDAFGTYTDTMPLTVFAIDAHPDSIKMVTGQSTTAYIPKAEIFETEHGTPPVKVPVDWVSSSDIVATVKEKSELTPPVAYDDDTHNHSEAKITAQGVGQAFISAVATDQNNGTSYSDTIRVTVGNVAILNPANNTIYLLSGTKYLDLTAVLTAGFTINADGWRSSNPSVVSVGTPSGTDNVNCRVSSVNDTVGSAIITVYASNGDANDSDTILVKVVDANYVTSGEMRSFTRGLYNNHGVIDWDPEHPGEMEVDDSAVNLATQEEVDAFIDGVFEEEMPNPVVGYKGKVYRYLGDTTTVKQYKGEIHPADYEHGSEITFTTDDLYTCVVDTSSSSTSTTYYKWQEYEEE